MFTTYKPGSVCGVQATIPAVGERGARGLRPLLTHYRACWFLEALATLAARGGLPMVAPNTPRLEFAPEVNLSRAFLFRASEAFNKGMLLEAGVLLREAVRRQLFAECCWKQCLPKKASDRTPPLILLKAIRKAGHVKGYWGFEIMKNIITLANKAAHCERIDRAELVDSIALWHGAIDSDPCGESFVRTAKYKPAESSCECVDDDDPADWWKKPEDRNDDDTDGDGNSPVTGGPKQ